VGKERREEGGRREEGLVKMNINCPSIYTLDNLHTNTLSQEPKFLIGELPPRFNSSAQGSMNELEDLKDLQKLVEEIKKAEEEVRKEEEGQKKEIEELDKELRRLLQEKDSLRMEHLEGGGARRKEERGNGREGERGNGRGGDERGSGRGNSRGDERGNGSGNGRGEENRQGRGDKRPREGDDTGQTGPAEKRPRTSTKM
jgi:hypothetical protein